MGKLDICDIGIISTIVLIPLLVLVFMVIAIVPAGHEGIIDTFGYVETYTLPSGFHFKSPVTGIYPMDIKTQKYTSAASSASRDLQDVKTEVTLNYRVNAVQAVKMYKEVGINYEDKVVVPAIQEAVKAATAQFTADQLITQRQQVKLKVEEILSERLLAYNLVVETVSLTDFSFSPQFTESIENKVKAEQDALRAENDLRRIEIEKEQTITQAEARAQSTKLQAEAEAYSLKVIREELQRGTELIQYRSIEKWDGVLPKFTGGGAVPFINITE